MKVILYELETKHGEATTPFFIREDKSADHVIYKKITNESVLLVENYDGVIYLTRYPYVQPLNDDYEYVISADTTFVSEEEFNAAYAAAMEVIKND